MNSIQQVLFQGIQKSLWNANIMFPDNTDWDAVISEAEDQAVLGIVIGAAPEILSRLILFAYCIIRSSSTGC